MTGLKGLTPLLEARDLTETMAFYRDRLGFSVDSTLPEQGEPSWCHMSSGAVKLMFVGPHSHDDDDHSHDHSEHGHDEHGHGSGPALSGGLYLYPGDVASLWERLKDQTEVAEPLHATDYGMREFTIMDPNGYTLFFGQNA